MKAKAGLQMYSVREAFRFNPVHTIEKISAIGFKYLELPWHNAQEETEKICGLDASAFIYLADKYNVVFTGGYVTGLNRDNMEETVRFYKSIGSSHITLPVGYFPDRETLETQTCFYNTLTEVCREYGMVLCYENHYHEFQKLNDTCILDMILDKTDSEGFWLNLNTYWLVRGLVDPFRAFQKYKNRIMALVQQDYPLDAIDKINMWEFYRYHPIARNIKKDVPLKGGEIENIHPVMCTLYTEIGDGIMKIREMAEKVKEADTVSYIFLKQDYTRMESEFDSIRRSRENYGLMQDILWD